VLDPITSQVFARIEALPGALTSTGFKLLSGRKEIAQRLEFLASLHDRQALVRREARRAFLGGEGFVAWPGPAFRSFVDQFIVHNRMLSGGFVLGGRTVSLADIRVPVLAFVGDHDDLARPAAVHAIKHAAPHATIRFARVKAGHFGLVVGSTAMRETWPTTAAWIHNPIQAVAESPTSHAYEPYEAAFSFDLGTEMLDAVATLGRTAWRRVGELAASASDAYDGIRYQEPHLRALAAMTDDTRVSASRMLADRARETPDATCFLWRGRAFTYAVAQRRVDDVVRGLWSCGVRRGWRVGVWMHSRPSLLTALTALMRLGAVAVLAPPESHGEALRATLHEALARAVVCDVDHVVRAHECGLATWVLGGGDRAVLPSGVVDMERIDPSQTVLPPDVALDAACAGDLALLLARPNGTSLRLVSVTHRRHLLSALGAAAACTLTPDDTVYCCLPLHHPTGVLVGVGAALAGGARLALGERFDPELFLTEVRRYGATVAFYAGEMLRALVHTPPSRGDRSHSLRLVAGSGMRADLWSKVSTRFGVGVMEFYASTSQRVVVANASGEKVGAIGRQLPGSAPFMVARVDLATRSVARDDDAKPLRANIGEAGVLLAREGHEWHTLDAVVRVDEDGDLWLLDTLGGYVWTRRGPVSTRAVEDALYTLPEVELAVAWGEGSAGEAHIVAAIATRTDLTTERIERCFEAMVPDARPRRVLQRRTLPMTDGFRPDRRAIEGG
jgi:putative long chain acyl-CoA synthase